MRTLSSVALRLAIALAPVLLPCSFPSAIAVRAAEPQPPITAIAFTPDGTSVVAVSQRGLRVLSWPALERLADQTRRLIDPLSANLQCLAFSPDGRHLAIGGGNPAVAGVVEVYAWPGGELIAKFDKHDDTVRSLAWVDNAQLVSASLDCELFLWNIEAESQASRAWRGHSRGINAIRVLDDGPLLVSAGLDQSLRVWEFDSGKLVRSLTQHTRPVQALAVKPTVGGLPIVASAASDRTIRFWQPTIGRMVRFVRLDSEPLAIEWLSDGSRVIAACVDGNVRVIDPDNVAVLQTLAGVDGWAYTIATHPTDGSAVVAGSGGQIRRLIIDEQSEP